MTSTRRNRPPVRGAGASRSTDGPLKLKVPPSVPDLFDTSIPKNRTEAARLKSLHSYEILDTPPEEAFDRITRLASRLIGTPVALVSLVDAERQWFKSRIGLDVEETPRDVAFCDHAIRTPDVMTVEDATQDLRFEKNPLVIGDPQIRAYAGAPLTSPHGDRLGTLCVIDFAARSFSDEDLSLLDDLARMVMDELELRRLATVARSARQHLFDAIDALPDAFVLYDADDRLVICNQRYRDVYSKTTNLLVPGTRFEDVLRGGVARGQLPDAVGREEEWVLERMEQHLNPPDVPIEQRLPDNRWLRIEERRTRDGGLVGFRIDITEHKRREELLEKLAATDGLTGLPNRTHFLDRLTLSVANAERTGLLMGLMFLDLDGFKHVNDTLGHGVGDEILQAVAARLRDCCRDTDTVARLGGDEFAIIVANIEDKNGVIMFAERIIAALTAPFEIGPHEIQIGTSIGITIFPDDFSETEGLIQNADQALYRAKEEGRGCWQLYDAAFQAEAQRRRTVEQELRRAVDNGEFILHYQPQIDVLSGTVTGSEALLRWLHPEKGLLPPAEFIPIAEQTRLIIPMGEWLLHEVCRQIGEWRSAGLPEIVCAANISTLEFRQPDFVKRVQLALDEHGLDPALLELEITESMAMDDRVDPMGVFNALNELGVRIAIDDFGTGYSSLGRLKNFPVDRLKIDRSFVDDICTRWDHAAISASVIQLGHTLNLQVIAEGVETIDQLEFLLDSGCHDMQGFYFSKPLPVDEFADYVRSSGPQQLQAASRREA